MLRDVRTQLLSSMIRTLKNITILLLLGLLIGCGVLYFLQGRLIYPAPNLPVVKRLPDHAQRIDLGVSYAYLLTPHHSSPHKSPLMIFAHGNGELADMWLGRFDDLLQHNIAVLLVEYPGYGDAKGTPTLVSIEQTMLNAYDKALAIPHIERNHVVAYGRSLGGGAVTLLAQKRHLSALGLESAFSSLPKLVWERGLPGILVRDRYDNEAILRNLKIPIFLYHGTKDQVIPFEHAVRLKNAAEDVTFYSEACGHNNCPRKWEEFIDFLRLKTDLSVSTL